jgi:hypothetical protein
MNIYEPYSVLEKQDALLHLKLSKEYKIMSVLPSRVLPLLLLIFIFLSFIVIDITITIWLVSGLVFIVFSTIILLNTGVGYEVCFKDSSIELYSLRLSGKRVKTIQLKDVDHMDLELFNEPRVSGAYYWLVLKNGRKELLLKFSTDLNLETERFLQLNKNLEELTKLKIEGHTIVL